jgi:DNA-binding protein H-NS
MAQTYLQIQQQIASLQRQSEALRLAEVKTAIEKAKAIIARFSLTAQQLGLSSASSAVTAPANSVLAKQAVAKKAVAKNIATKKAPAKKAVVKPTPAPVLPAPPAVPVPAQKAMAPATKKVAAPAAKKVAAPVAKKAAGPAAKQPSAVAVSTAAPPAPTQAATPAIPAPAAKKAAPKYVAAIRYRDGDTNSWSGFGPKPKWLVAGIAAGRTLESFAVGK